QLIGAEQAVGEGDAEHEEPTGFSLATGAAGCSRSVSLRVNPPPLEVGAGPFRTHRVATKPGEFLDFIERGPRVLFALEPLDLLRLGLFPGWCRQCAAQNLLLKKQKALSPVMRVGNGTEIRFR